MKGQLKGSRADPPEAQLPGSASTGLTSPTHGSPGGLVVFRPKEDPGLRGGKTSRESSWTFTMGPGP